MEIHRQQKRVSLAAHCLPGADTKTKLEAIQSTNRRCQLLLAEAARVGWPVGFCNDLYLHDRKVLEDHPDDTMIWILRENGTHLYRIPCESTGEARYCRQVIEYWSGEDKLNYVSNSAERARFYLLIQDRLQPITWQVARESLRVRPVDQCLRDSRFVR